MLVSSSAPVTLLAQQGTPPADSGGRRDSTRTQHPAGHLPAVTITAAPSSHREPASVVHVSASAIQLAPASTPGELLRQTAGVEVHQQGQGPGFASDASLRGFSSDHSTDIALWIDGVPVNEPVNGHAEGYNDWSVLFPAAIQDIDVIRGPTSALYGNFALAGVVNVRTLERTARPQVILTGGDFGRLDATLLTGFDHGTRGSGVFGVRGMREDGFRPNSDDGLLQGHGRYVRDLSPGITLDAGTELYGARWRSPGYLSEEQLAARDYGIVSNRTDGGFERRAQERVSLRVLHGDLIWRTTTYATQGRWQLFLTIPPAGGQFEGTGSQTEEEDTRYGLGLTSALTYAARGVTATLGTEGRFDHAHYENYFTTARVRDSSAALVTGSQLSGALFAQSDLTFGAFRLDAGARLDALTTRSTPVGTGRLAAMHGILSPKVGALVHLSPVIALYANVSRGFRSSDGTLTDPSLPLITEWAYEAGVKLTRGTVYVGMDAFRMNVSNEQTFDPITARSVNGGASVRRGVELDVRAPLAPYAALSADWTFNDARYVHRLDMGGEASGQPVDLSGLRVYNTARYVGSAGFTVGPDVGLASSHWALRVGGNWVGPYSPFDEPGVVLGGYGLLHVGGRVRLTPDIALEVGVRNVLDRVYPEVVAGHIAAPGEPRAAYITLRYGM